MKHWPTLPGLQQRLESLQEQHRLRVEPRATARLSYSSNDYLGLGDGVGAEASRLLGANRTELDLFEAELGAWLGGEPTVVGSGYQANMAAVGALIHREDLVLSDAQNHASLVDALRLSRAEVKIVPHVDQQAWENSARSARERYPHRKIWAVTESYFSMSAESPNLSALLPALNRWDVCTLVDESHAIGVFGPEGRGLVFTADGPLPHIATFGLGKSFAGSGGVICGGDRLRAVLINDARPVMFSTAPAPILLRAMRTRLAALRHSDGLRERLSCGARVLRNALQSAGFTVLGHGPIVPVLIGSEQAALSLSKRLLERGFDAPAIRYPTVAEGRAILRLNVSARQPFEEHYALVAAMKESV